MRRDRDFRMLLVDTLQGIRKIYETRDVDNDPEAYNQLVNSVSFLEDLLIPYTYKIEYKPEQTGETLQDVHERIRGLMFVARDVALMPPEEIVEDADEFTIPDT